MWIFSSLLISILYDTILFYMVFVYCRYEVLLSYDYTENYHNYNIKGFTNTSLLLIICVKNKGDKKIIKNKKSHYYNTNIIRSKLYYAYIIIVSYIST